MKRVFQSSSETEGAPGYSDRTGQVVEIVRELDASECDIAEVGKMCRIRFADGVETDAFADELRTLQAKDVAKGQTYHIRKQVLTRVVPAYATDMIFGVNEEHDLIACFPHDEVVALKYKLHDERILTKDQLDHDDNGIERKTNAGECVTIMGILPQENCYQVWASGTGGNWFMSEAEFEAETRPC